MGFLDPLLFANYQDWKDKKLQSKIIDMQRNNAIPDIRSQTIVNMSKNPYYDPMNLNYRFRLIKEKFVALSSFETKMLLVQTNSLMFQQQTFQA